MWADNEVTVDLLNVAHITAAVLKLVDDDNVAPVTIGVYGDWGSGKSTVLRLVESALTTKERKDSGLVCVWFNSWQFETYDDSKAALMSAILEQLRKERGALAKAKSSLVKFAKRVEWMRLAGLAAKGIARVKLAVVTAGVSEVGKGIVDAVKGNVGSLELGDLGNLIKEDEEAEGAGPHSVREFREEFAKLLEEADVSRLVVIIDDLDRCLPDRVVDTLEAIKLFLLVPRTAFILGADEEVVRRSVQARFAAVADAKEQLGRDYLEKLIQIPVPIPPMSQEESEGYMNLLFTQLRLEQTEFAALCEKRAHSAIPPIGRIPFAFDDAKEYLGVVPPELQEDFVLVGQIGAVLAEHAAGNPRQTKRFLNALMLRLEMASARKAKVQINIMAKLMLLEYVRRESFFPLAQWQRLQDGKPNEISVLEAASKAGGDTSALDPSLRRWLEDEWLRRWISSEPKLAGEDLGPYFYFARTRPAYGPLAQRLTPAAAGVFEALQSAAESDRLRGSRAAQDITDLEASAIFTALADRITRSNENDLGKENSPLMALFLLATQKTFLIGDVVALLDRIPAQPLPLNTLTQLATLVSYTPHAEAALRLLQKWETDDKDTRVGKSANTMKSRVRTGTAPSRPSRLRG